MSEGCAMPGCEEPQPHWHDHGQLVVFEEVTDAPAEGDDDARRSN